MNLISPEVCKEKFVNKELQSRCNLFNEVFN